MLYGITASQSIKPAPGTPASPSGAVNIDDSVTQNGLVVTSQTTADNSLITIAVRARIPSDYSMSPWVCVLGAPAAGYAGSSLYIDYSGAVRFVLHNSAGSKSLDYGSAYSVEAFSTGVWHDIFVSANTNYGAGAKLHNMLVDGVNVVSGTNTYDSDTAFNIGINGKAFGVPTESSYLSSVWQVIELADLWIGVGQYVAPADAPAKFGAGGSRINLGTNGELPTGTPPTYYFTGNAANFITNRGNGDAVTLIGSITNAATSP